MLLFFKQKTPSYPYAIQPLLNLKSEIELLIICKILYVQDGHLIDGYLDAITKDMKWNPPLEITISCFHAMIPSNDGNIITKKIKVKKKICHG